MYIQEKKGGPRNGAMILNVMHVTLGLLIVALGVMTFLDPEGHMFFFPVIFFLGGVLNLADGTYMCRRLMREKKSRTAGWLLNAVGIFLLAVSGLSAFSIWR